MRILSLTVHRTSILRSLAVAVVCCGVALTATSAVAQVPQPPAASLPGAFVVDTDQLAKVAAAVVPTPPPASSVAPSTAVPAAPPIAPSKPFVKKAAKAKAASTGLRLLEPQSAPATTATTATTADAAPASASAGGAIAETVWAALRKCESNGNYAINTGNGYYGAYQFAASTWRKLGYSGLPHEASAATQDQAARKLQAQQGWGPWPACTRRLGLR